MILKLRSRYFLDIPDWNHPAQYGLRPTSLPAEHIFIGGIAEARPHYRIDISIMQGAMSDNIKQQVVAEMTQVILEMEGEKMNPFNASRVWVLIHEITDGNWGAAGHIYRLDDLMKYLK